MMQYGHYKAAELLSKWLPQRLAYWLGLRIADQYYRHDRFGREAVVDNLRHVYAGKGIAPSGDVLEGVARKTFQHFGKYLVDFFRYTRLSLRDLDRLVSVERREYLDECFEAKRGVILLSAHFGNWEMGAAAIAAMGYPLHAVVLAQPMKKVDELFQHYREERGYSLLPLGNAAIGVIRCLRQGHIVALMGDRDFSHRGRTASLFGRPAHLATGPALLSMKTGAPVLPTFSMRNVDDTFRLRFHKPLWPGSFKTAEELQLSISRIMENEIAAAPHQWFIFEKLWND